MEKNVRLSNANDTFRHQHGVHAGGAAYVKCWKCHWTTHVTIDYNIAGAQRALSVRTVYVRRTCGVRAAYLRRTCGVPAAYVLDCDIVYSVRTTYWYVRVLAAFFGVRAAYVRRACGARAVCLHTNAQQEDQQPHRNFIVSQSIACNVIRFLRSNP